MDSPVTEPTEYELASFLITVRGPAPDPDFAPEQFDNKCDVVKAQVEDVLTRALDAFGDAYAFTMDGDDL